MSEQKSSQIIKQSLSKTCQHLLKTYLPLLKFFLIFLIIYLVAFSAILLTDVYYADDVGRAAEGYSSWWPFSRYISEIISHFLHADLYLTDISPLPQLLAILISSLSNTLLLYAFVGKALFEASWKKYIWYIIATTPLVLCPYFLECMSYKYDAPYMAISVLAAIIPVFFRSREKWQFALSIFLSTLIICTSYQASLGILPMILVFFAFREWFEAKTSLKEALKNLGFAALIILLSLLFFRLALMSKVNTYITNEFPALSDFFPTFLKNFTTYFGMLFSDFKLVWLLLLAIICLLFTVVSVTKTKQNKFACLVLAILSGGLMTLFVYGFYSLFTKPLFAPRAAYSLGAFISLLGLFIVHHTNKFATKLVIFVLSWCFFVFTFTYGNALKVQDNYINAKLSNVVSDLNDLELSSEQKTLRLSGKIGFAPAIANMPQTYQLY